MKNSLLIQRKLTFFTQQSVAVPSDLANESEAQENRKTTNENNTPPTPIETKKQAKRSFPQKWLPLYKQVICVCFSYMFKDNL